MYNYAIQGDLVIFPDGVTNVPVQVIMTIAQKIEERLGACGKIEEDMASELLRYKDETIEERITRAAMNYTNWSFEPYEERHVTKEDVRCACKTCWYSRNSAHLSGYSGSYRLLGTKTVYLCDVCIDTSLNADELRRPIESDYEQTSSVCSHNCRNGNDIQCGVASSCEENLSVCSKFRFLFLKYYNFFRDIVDVIYCLDNAY